MPEGVDWTIERILTSTRYKATRRELETWWSFDDLMIAHATLDMLEEAESSASDRARREADAKRPPSGPR